MRLVCLLVFLCVSLPAAAQEKPDSPRPNRRVFFSGVAILGASQAADGITTRQLLDRGGWENDPLFGRHPSPARQSFVSLGVFAVRASVFYATEHNRRAWLRWIGRAFVAYSVADNVQAARCNAAVDTRPGAPVQNCGPIGGIF